MLAIDTNVLVRLVAKDDAAQTQIARARTSGGAWVSHVVLAESIWVLASSHGMLRPQVIDTIETLLEHRDVAFEDRSVVARALGLFRRRKAVEFSDCLILEIARKAGHAPMATFDRDFAKLEGVERLG
jgi:predicted nucleic-acid-binding protein